MDVDLFRTLLSYDPNTGIFEWQHDPFRAVGGTDSKGYRRVRIARKEYQLHRVAWAIVHGKEPAAFIDHINGNRSDNRLCNLREATFSTNGMNRGKPNIPSYSRFKGVTFHRKLRKWQAAIKADGRNYYLGVFATEEEAHRAYCDALPVYHGQFGRAA